MATASPREADPIFSIDYVDTADPSHADRVAVEPEPDADVPGAVETGAAVTGSDATEASQVLPTRDELDPRSSGETYVTVWRTDVEEQPQTPVAAELAAAPGMPGRGVIVLSLVAAGLCAPADCALTGTLTMFFDLCFVTVCLVGAMAVRREDLFTTGVLAPLAFAVVVFAVALGVNDAFVVGGSLSSQFFTGLAAHAGALVAGYGVALAVVGARVGAARSAWS